MYFLQELRGHLLDNLDEAFPEETQAYRDLRSAAAVSGNGIFVVCLFTF
jgi:hypothetical protein